MNNIKELIEDPDLEFYGEKIYLRKLKISDCTDRYLSWLNDETVNRYSSRYKKRFYMDDLRNYVDQMNSKKSNHLLVGIFDIINKEKHIGNTLLGPIDYNNCRSEISNLIGEKDFWGKGVAFESCRILIHYAFSVLDLNKITIGNISKNRGATFLTKQLGFALEGKLIAEMNLDNKYYDVLRFGLFKDSFYKKFPNLAKKVFSNET